LRMRREAFVRAHARCECDGNGRLLVPADSAVGRIANDAQLKDDAEVANCRVTRGDELPMPEYRIPKCHGGIPCTVGCSHSGRKTGIVDSLLWSSAFGTALWRPCVE
jgi:hypothetical protein